MVQTTVQEKKSGDKEVNKENTGRQEESLQRESREPTPDEWKRIENEDKIFVAVGLSFMALAYQMRNLISYNPQEECCIIAIFYKYISSAWHFFCIFLIFVFLYIILLRFYAVILDDIQIRWKSIRQLALYISVSLITGLLGIFTDWSRNFLESLSSNQWIRSLILTSPLILYLISINFFFGRIFWKWMFSAYEKSRYFRILGIEGILK